MYCQLQTVTPLSSLSGVALFKSPKERCALIFWPGLTRIGGERIH
jgi:hypothetical protein